ncbi:MAG: hypothetical protein WCH62_07825, partial [Candidatus Omnitrophota bacterium]
ALDALVDHYGEQSPNSSPYHIRFLKEVLQLNMTFVPVDIKSHKGDPYYSTVHVAALLSPEGAARALEAMEEFFSKKATKVEGKEGGNNQAMIADKG